MSDFAELEAQRLEVSYCLDCRGRDHREGVLLSVEVLEGDSVEGHGSDALEEGNEGLLGWSSSDGCVLSGCHPLGNGGTGPLVVLEQLHRGQSPLGGAAEGGFDLHGWLSGSGLLETSQAAGLSSVVASTAEASELDLLWGGFAGAIAAGPSACPVAVVSPNRFDFAVTAAGVFTNFGVGGDHRWLSASDLGQQGPIGRGDFESTGCCLAPASPIELCQHRVGLT